MLCTVIHKVAGWREREKCREMWSFLSATKILAIFGDCDKVIYYSLLTEKEENVCKPFFKKKKKSRNNVPVKLYFQPTKYLGWYQWRQGTTCTLSCFFLICWEKAIKYKAIFPWRCSNTWAPIHDVCCWFLLKRTFWAHNANWMIHN